MSTIKVHDINLYYEIYGEGEPLVLIQGLGLDSSAWLNQTPAFSQKYQVIIFDNRGIGRTDAPKSSYSTEILVDDTVALLNALALDNAHVLGFSMGGFIAQKLAHKYPEKIKSLILAGTAAKLSPRATKIIQVWLRMLKEQVNPETRMRAQLPWLFTEKFFENSEQVEALIQLSLAYPYLPTIHGFAGQVAACVEHNSLNYLNQIVSPALVLAGQEDMLIPVKLSQELARGLPNAELLILEGGGHNFFYEIPEQFNRAVLNFLDN
jgi:pimeloyl-ACP methyl ester carboxylesterase